MKKQIFAKTTILIIIAVFGLHGPVFADTSKLIGQLVDLLGVSQIRQRFEGLQ